MKTPELFDKNPSAPNSANFTDIDASCHLGAINALSSSEISKVSFERYGYITTIRASAVVEKVTYLHQSVIGCSAKHVEVRHGI